MNVIVNKDRINSVQSAAEAGRNLAEEQIQKSQDDKAATLNTLKDISATFQENNLEDQKQLAAILALPEDQFAILAPVFLEEFRRTLHNTNEKLVSAELMHATGITLENVEETLTQVYDVIDQYSEHQFSTQKKDFLKQIIGASYNILAETEGVAKRKIVVPIEYCRPNAKMPTYAHLTDAGMDVFATEEITIAPGETKLIPIGIKVALPAGYELQVRPKSGRCLKTKLRVANTPGTIDAGYRDEIGVIIDNIEPFIKSAKMDENGKLYDVEFGSSFTIGAGEKFAQLVLSEVPKAIFYEVESVGEIANDGRQGGFGSTGVK